MNESQDNPQDYRAVQNRPADDSGLIHIDGYIKIFYPDTEHVIVEVRE